MSADVALQKRLMKELGELLKLLSNPDRALMIQALAGSAEISVTEIATQVGITPTRASQHFALLKAFRLVVERTEGRHRLYSLSAGDLPEWLLQGLDFVAHRVERPPLNAGNS